MHRVVLEEIDKVVHILRVVDRNNLTFGALRKGLSEDEPADAAKPINS
jgi:hypothetical protein